jgi:hypothetical protein
VSGSFLSYLSSLYHLVSPFLGLFFWFIVLGVAIFAFTGVWVARGRGVSWPLGLVLGGILGPFGILFIGVLSIAQDRQAASTWTGE